MFEVLAPFFYFLFFMSIFRAIVNSKGKDIEKGRSTYWNEEQRANFTRKKDLPPEIFYQVDAAKLPFREYEGDAAAKLSKLRDDVKKKSSRKMLRLSPPMTNLEIKYAFGYANLQSVVSYEENYESFIRSLNAWAEELIKASFTDDAQAVLEMAVDMESVITKTYTLISEIYVNKGHMDKLAGLNKRINEMKALKQDDFLHKKIIACIDGALPAKKQDAAICLKKT